MAELSSHTGSSGVKLAVDDNSNRNPLSEIDNNEVVHILALSKPLLSQGYAPDAIFDIVHEAFTEDADLAADIMGTLVKNIQGAELGAGSVMLTMKHFPGGGPQLDGADPHYDFGKNQAYPANNFDYHLKPFRAAIDGVAAASGADFAVIRVTVDNSGHLPYLFYGGANPDELSKLSFSSMTDAASWKMTSSLTDINTVMAAVGAENTVISIYFRQPYVIDDASGVRDAGALLATFGVSDNALMDVLTGVQNPQGKLPFALANNLQAVIDQDEDAPGYPGADTLYPFGHGLSYPMP